MPIDREDFMQMIIEVNKALGDFNQISNHVFNELWYRIEAYESAKASEPVSLKEAGESVRQFFDLTLVGPDCGFKPEDVAKIIAEKWRLSYVD